METKELLKKVRKIEIKTRRLSENLFGGEYQSTFKGRGMTFSEVRKYEFGDDVRSIDWNVTAIHSVLLPDYSVMTFGSFSAEFLKNGDVRKNKEIKLSDGTIMKRDNGSSVNCSGITFGKIIPHLQQLFNTDKKMVSVYTNLTYVRNTGPSTNSSSIGSIHLNGISHDKTFNPGASPALDNNDIRITSCFKEPCSNAENNLSYVINID